MGLTIIHHAEDWAHDVTPNVSYGHWARIMDRLEADCVDETERAILWPMFAASGSNGTLIPSECRQVAPTLLLIGMLWLRENRRDTDAALLVRLASAAADCGAFDAGCIEFC